MATAKSGARCPDCERKIGLWPSVKVGEQVVCPYCEAELEIINLAPVELDWAYVTPADDDDWDDEDEDE